MKKAGLATLAMAAVVALLGAGATPALAGPAVFERMDLERRDIVERIHEIDPSILDRLEQAVPATGTVPDGGSDGTSSDSTTGPFPDAGADEAVVPGPGPVPDGGADGTVETTPPADGGDEGTVPDTTPTPTPDSTPTPPPEASTTTPSRPQLPFTGGNGLGFGVAGGAVLMVGGIAAACALRKREDR